MASITVGLHRMMIVKDFFILHNLYYTWLYIVYNSSVLHLWLWSHHIRLHWLHRLLLHRLHRLILHRLLLHWLLLHGITHSRLHTILWHLLHLHLWLLVIIHVRIPLSLHFKYSYLKNNYFVSSTVINHKNIF